MSLTPKRKMTEKNLAAHRRNGPKSRGAVTPAGKSRSARANLRHGFYARESPEVMIALGENPDDYRRLVDSLENNLAEGLENQLVRGIGRALWRMQRSERMQDGLALKRVQKGMQTEDLVNGARLLENNSHYQHLLDLARDLAYPNYFPSTEDMLQFARSFGAAPSDKVQILFPLLKALSDAGPKLPGPVAETPEGNPGAKAADGEGAESARQELQEALHSALLGHRKILDLLLEESESIHSSGNIAALMAPRHENSMLMQRMEDSSLRQLWRLTSMLVKVRNGALE